MSILKSARAKKRRENLATVEDNPDPFDTNTFNVRSIQNKSSSKRSNKRRNKGTKRNSYNNYNLNRHHHRNHHHLFTDSPDHHQHVHPKKKRKTMNPSNVSSHHSNSSSDLEILSNGNNHNHHNHHNNHNHHHHHTHRNGHHQSKKKQTKSSYNVYANGVIPDLSSNGLESPFSPIPFPRERDRRKLHSHDTLSLNHSISMKSGHSKRSRKNKSGNDSESIISRLSRRSKSRSPSPVQSQSPLSMVTSKMTEAQDKLALLQVESQQHENQNHEKNEKKKRSNHEKSEIAFRNATNDALESKTKHKQRRNKKYSSLTSFLPTSSGSMRRYKSSRNTAGKHRPKRLKRHKRQFLNMRTSTLDEIPISNHHSMARDGEILVSNLNKKEYQNLMEETKKKTRLIEKNLNPELADFVKETDLRSMRKDKHIHIDLTNDMDEDTESTEIEQMNVDTIDDNADIEILNDTIATKYALKRHRKQSYQQFNDDIANDVYSSQRFELDFDAKQLFTNKIVHFVEEYQKKKEAERKRIEEEKKRKEEEERLKQLEKQKQEELSKVSLTSKVRDNKFRELDDDDDLLIEQIFELPPNKEVGTHQGSNLVVHVKDLNTLESGQWLNDEVMNFYMALLQDRNIKRCKENPKHCRVLLMNTFFYTKLSSNSYSYKSVKRWTKKIKLSKKGLTNISTIFELDKMIFPVHVNNIHWCCGCINFKDKKIEYYDSMNGSASQFFATIRKYIGDEFKDKLKSDKSKYDLNLNEWNHDDNRRKYPQQQNGVDCGVFTSKCADWISDDLYPDYSQRNMEYFRNRMMVEIIRGKTLDF